MQEFSGDRFLKVLYSSAAVLEKLIVNIIAFFLFLMSIETHTDVFALSQITGK